MPPPRKAAPKRDPRQGAALRRVMFLDALRSWVIPLGGAAAALLLWVLYNIEVISPTRAVTWAGGLALLVALYAALREFLDERTTLPAAAVAAGFAIAFALVTFIPFYRAVNPPPPVFEGDLRAQAAPVAVALHGESGRYRLIVEGHFRPAANPGSRSAHYQLMLRGLQSGDRMLEGDFSESWRRQRLGRRGSVPVHVTNEVTQHEIDSPDGGDLALGLVQLSPDAQDSVHVRVYRDAFPMPLFVGLGVLLTAAALLVDALRGIEPGNSLVTGVTLAALAGVGAFRAFASARPGFGDVLVYGGLGTLLGLAAGAGLWRLTRAYLRRLLHDVLPWLNRAALQRPRSSSLR